jgi:hypothetical protein
LKHASTRLPEGIGYLRFRTADSHKLFDAISPMDILCAHVQSRDIPCSREREALAMFKSTGELLGHHSSRAR